MATTVTIRRSSPEEAETLTTIALEAKRYWGYPEHWIKHWESDLTISPDFIRDNHVYVAEADGEIRGFYALCVNGDKAELEHMWVTPACIGTGIGKELFLDAMERAAALDVRDVELSADPNAAGFYERMGAKQIGEVESPIDGQVRKLPRLKIEPS
ncbi:MAG TPA: GNAT family N-acetyltransferase [Pyrinomonadaceae bacterium]|nr:GNAT family N-acetyltransferase [Pyrinomonadaceae bacterium]